MGVLARPSAQPPIDVSGNFPTRMYKLNIARGRELLLVLACGLLLVLAWARRGQNIYI